MFINLFCSVFTCSNLLSPIIGWRNAFPLFFIVFPSFFASYCGSLVSTTLLSSIDFHVRYSETERKWDRKERKTVCKDFLEITKKLEEFEDGDTFRLTGCSVWVFPLVIAKRKDRMKREHIFDVRL